MEVFNSYLKSKFLLIEAQTANIIELLATLKVQINNENNIKLLIITYYL